MLNEFCIKKKNRSFTSWQLENVGYASIMANHIFWQGTNQYMWLRVTTICS